MEVIRKISYFFYAVLDTTDDRKTDASGRLGLAQRKLFSSGSIRPGISRIQANLMRNVPEPAHNWFAVVVKPQQERAVELALASKGFQTYLPLYVRRRRCSDRFKELLLPLFPGYVFCRFQRQQKPAVVATPSVRSVVCFASIPAPIPDTEIDRLRQIHTSGLALSPWPYRNTGQQVRIVSGPLRGVEGILARQDSDWRVVVNVELLQRSVAVSVDREDLRSCAAKSQPPWRRYPYAYAAQGSGWC